MSPLHIKIKNALRNYGGIVVGVLYGLILRVFFYSGNDFEFASLFSIAFVWIVPIAIGVIPIIFATDDQLNSNSYSLGRPILTVFLFFMAALITRLEDIICILFISFPFLVSAGAAGYAAATFVKESRERKGLLFCVVVLPFCSAYVEGQLPTPSQVYEVNTTVIVDAEPSRVWQNIVRVSEIKREEYNSGFFNYVGIPRPLFAELDKDTVGATRIGHFEGGLEFRETVTTWERNKTVSFTIRVDPSTIRAQVFDQHVLKGGHFTFVNARYTLVPVNNSQTKLTLSSSYRLDTNVNGYGSFWGEILLSDFQHRLLDVIKKRCDNGLDSAR